MLYSIFPSTSVCSSSLLRANLSTCKEGILDEALKLIVNHRLRGNEWEEADQSTSQLTDRDQTILCPQYDTMDGQAPTGKYASLFTFTSNRYNITPTARKPVRNEQAPVNYEDALVWEDVKQSGFVFWYRNKTVYTRLALRMGMVGRTSETSSIIYCIFFPVQCKGSLLVD